MKPTEILKAIAYPLTESAVLIPLVVFWLLIELGNAAGMLGLFLLVIVAPALFRYMTSVLEARARGATPPAPGIEYFQFVGNGWMLFPLLLVLLLVLAVGQAEKVFGLAGRMSLLIVFSLLFPSVLAVLAITHSPLQSLNPVALWRLQRACGQTLWIATVFLLCGGWLVARLDVLPGLLAGLVNLLLVFAFYSLVGSLIEPYGLVDDIDIPEPRERSAAETAGDIERHRTAVLGHAYGFLSRDNRDGGFKHIRAALDEDPDPVAAWRWYFEKMLGWENRQHALYFGQLYIHDMLVHGETVPALKVLMRCRLVDESFRPLAEDRPRLAAAAEASGNSELAAVLNRS